MMVLSLFIIGHMGLFFYNKIGSIISIGDLPTTNIIEPKKVFDIYQTLFLFIVLLLQTG
ncbi:hypothetical protein GM536_06965 [Streptococcus pneumoniae]|uniref:Uncharacterized protein n=1 Tax=Streptococcus pneumoniae TaxID=1313 RepID=A0A6I3UVX7_STREE|nr:hypothetical protein [Streptococcus pneumoniae]